MMRWDNLKNKLDGDNIDDNDKNDDNDEDNENNDDNVVDAHMVAHKCQGPPLRIEIFGGSQNLRKNVNNAAKR